MSGQDDVLRLVAEVVNKWSGPLAQMRKDLEGLGKHSKGTHVQGAKDAREHAKAFGELKHSVRDVAEHVKGGLEPAFESFGITALSVAGAVAAVAEAIKNFAGTSRELKFFSREVGLSINQLREMDALAKRIGSTPDTMRSGFASFAKNMEELRRHRGALNQFFASQHNVGVRQFGNELSRAATNSAALAKSLQFLDRIKDPTQRQNFLAALGLDPKLARLSSGELRASLKDIRSSIGELSDEGVRKGIAAQQAFDKLAETVEKLKEEIGVELAGSITRLTTAITNFVAANRDGLVATLSDLAHWIEHTDWKQFGHDLKETAKNINDVAEKLGGWKTVAEALIALKLASWIGGVALAVGGLARSVGVLAAASGGLPALLALWAVIGHSDTSKDAEKWGLAKRLGLTPDEAKRSDFVTPEALRNKLTLSQMHAVLGLPPPAVTPAHEGSPQWGSDAMRKMEESTKKGTTAGVMQAFAQMNALAGLGGDGTGGPGGGGGGGGGRGLNTYGGAVGRRGPAGDLFVGGVKLPPLKIGPGGYVEGGIDRRRAAELLTQHPEYVAKMASMIQNEVGLGPSRNLNKQIIELETLFNRAQSRGHVPWADLHSASTGGYYGGALRSVSPGQVDWFRKNVLDPVLKGSDLGTSFLHGRTPTGNASQMGFAGRRLQQGYYSAGRWWGDRPGHDEMFVQERGDAARAQRLPRVPYGKGPRAVPGEPAGPSQLYKQPELPSFRSSSLLHAARLAGLIGEHKVTGDASLRIDLNGFPQGTKTAAEASGMFKTVRLNRGRTMTLASEEA